MLIKIRRKKTAHAEQTPKYSTASQLLVLQQYKTLVIKIIPVSAAASTKLKVKDKNVKRKREAHQHSIEDDERIATHLSKGIHDFDH